MSFQKMAENLAFPLFVREYYAEKLFSLREEIDNFSVDKKEMTWKEQSETFVRFLEEAIWIVWAAKILNVEIDHYALSVIRKANDIEKIHTSCTKKVKMLLAQSKNLFIESD